MTSPSDYAVHGPDHAHEVTGLVPVTEQDKRFPRRAPNGKRRRQPRPGPGQEDAVPPPDEAPDEAPDGQTPPAAGAG